MYFSIILFSVKSSLGILPKLKFQINKFKKISCREKLICKVYLKKIVKTCFIVITFDEYKISVHILARQGMRAIAPLGAYL